MDTFHERFKYLLEKEGVAIAVVADMVGVHADTIKNYTRIGSNPKMDTLLKMGLAFPHWSIEYLIAGEGTPFKDMGGTESSSTDSFTPPTVYAKMEQGIAMKQNLIFDLATMPTDSHHGLLGEALEGLFVMLEESTRLLGKWNTSPYQEGQ